MTRRLQYFAMTAVAVFLAFGSCADSICLTPLSSWPPGDGTAVVTAYLAALSRARMGTEYLFTYGPLGFAMVPMGVDRFLFTLALGLRMAEAGLWAGAIAAWLFFALRLKPWAAFVILAMLAIPSANGAYSDFTAAVAAVFMLGLLDLRSRAHPLRRIPSWAFASAAGALLAAGALMKVSQLPLAAFIAAVWMPSHASGPNGNFRDAASFGIAALIVYFGAFIEFGGGLRQAFIWPIAALPLISGYPWAMSLAGDPGQLAMACCVLGLFAFGVGEAAMNSIVPKWACLAAAAMAFTLFKEGFVRHDYWHMRVFFAAMPPCALLLWRPQSKPRPWGAASLGGVLALCFVTTVNAGGIVNPARLVRQAWRGGHYIASSGYAGRLAEEDRNAALGIYPELRALRRTIQGRRAFYWPWWGNAVVALEGREAWAPEPLEYSAYTSSLDERDAAFFSSSRRPALGLLSIDSEDDRMPLQTAGGTFLQILSCYKPAAVDGDLLVVARGGSPLGPCPSRSLRKPARWISRSFDSWIEVPAKKGALVFARLQVKPSFLARLMSFLFKPPPLYMTVKAAQGPDRTFRLIDRTLDDGILISPVLTSAEQAAEIWLGCPRDPVKSIKVWGAPWGWPRRFKISFYPQHVRSPGPIRLADPGKRSELAGVMTSLQAIEGGGHWLKIAGRLFSIRADDPLDEISQRGLGLVRMLDSGRAQLIPSYLRIVSDKATDRRPAPGIGFAALIPRRLWPGRFRWVRRLPGSSKYETIGRMSAKRQAPPKGRGAA